MRLQTDWRFSLRFLLLLLSFCYGRSDTITSTNFIKDPATIASNGSTFKLGFFSPLNSTRRYVGIWLNNISVQTIVWVANRDSPLNDTSGIFTISKDGNLVVLDGNDTVLWSSNVSSPLVNTSAQILDTGNLILQDAVSGFVIWESFQHPSNVFLYSMKLITNKDMNSKDKVQLTSWKNPSDPSTGNFLFGLDVQYLPELVIWNGRNPYWRSGPWNGNTFIGRPEMTDIYLSGYNLVIGDNTYTLSTPYRSVDMQEYEFLSLSSQGNWEQKYWDAKEAQLKNYWSALGTQCDFYGACGTAGICDVKASPVCSCIKGFKPKHEEEWNKGNWSRGCVRKTPLNCTHNSNNATAEAADGFFKLETIKLPFLEQWSNASYYEDECRQECFTNCSCTAYAFEKGIGCMLWRRDDLIDIQKFESGGADLYLRMAYADLDHTTNQVKDKKRIIIAIVLPGTFIIFITIAIYFWWRLKTHKHEKKTSIKSSKKGKILKCTRDDDTIGDEIELEELPLYDFEELAIATNNFDLSNQLGQGGFGPVYKGKLLNGQEIAIKRLSRTSNQGYEEFITEVKVISKLQHRNLVQLLGCCIEGEEKMLIYEYMANGSLDAMIFDSSKQSILDWKKRFNIIDGIARGLLYLHRDSRLKIIHRDLKASNILLDKNLNPKISDFGTARIFGGDEVEANTIRVVGT
ncbi:G-type lectin S-receptor-like serine/threonine-protein kinase SD1-13 isoform X2 [Momordica charantia]|nr:G-type lectin S-receptor-like serine/threonine-protein kinase SD1-13 isoform X2 [Momordica charantia]